MINVRFYETVEDSLLKFAVIIARSAGKWVICRHKERDTYEVPGDTERTGRTFLKPPEGSCRKKPEPLHLI